MNASNHEKLNALFLEFLKESEASDSAMLPSQQAESLSNAVIKAHQVIERLALFGAGLDANLEALKKRLEALEQSNPELLKQMDEHIGSLIGLRDTFLAFFEDEAQFCRQFEKMARDRLVAEAGVDPNDQGAVMAYLLQCGKQPMVPPTLGRN